MLPLTLKYLKILIRWAALLALAALFVAVIIFFLYGKVFPWLASHPTLSRLAVFEGAAERVTVIERNESITVTEADFIPRLATDAQNVLVTVVSRPASLGTGKPLTGSGFFVTNDGVVALHQGQLLDAPETVYTVYTIDGQAHSAELIGVDPYTEIALLRAENVNAFTLPFARTAEFGSGRKTLLMKRIGGTAGAPSVSLGLAERFQFTQNIASQSLASSEKYEGVYVVSPVSEDQQGALVINMQGELVGMAIMKKLDNVERTYILPNTAIDETLRGIEEGSLKKRNILGVSYTSLTPEIAEMYDVPLDAGAWLALNGQTAIATTLYGSPASLAGIRSGDIITKVGDTWITPEVPLSRVVQAIDSDSEVIFTVFRAGETIEIPVKF